MSEPPKPSEAEKEHARGLRNAFATPEERAAWYARPENDQSAATPEQIEEWRKRDGSLIHDPWRPDFLGNIFSSLF